MAVVNQQLDDDNKHESGSKSSVGEIARVNAPKDAQKERMIRQYLEFMWHLIRYEDDNNHIAGERASAVDELARSFGSTEAEMGRVIGLYKDTLWRIIFADIKAKQQQILSVIKEKSGFHLSTGRNSGNRASTSESPVFQFRFLNGISTQVTTSCNIKGKDNEPLLVALVDPSSGQTVTTGAASATEVEIVVLQGDCNDVEAENWTSSEFNNMIIHEWNGKKVLQGNSSLKLKEGTVSVNNISFTHNSTWKRNTFCRLGARSKDAVFATRVKEAKTESFLVMDKRSSRYNKHETPTLYDDVYRLHKINYRSDRYIRLSEAHIKTVMDLRTLNAINPERLKDILKVHPNEWKTIMNHAHMCKDSRGIYLYHHSSDDQKRDGVVFNVSGQLVGLVSDYQFVPSDKLPSDKKADAEKLVLSASEHWEDVVPFNDEASLINHLQPGTTFNSFPNPNALITPISPYDNDLKNNVIVGVPPTGRSSQSPKRPASEHALSNSPKKPRDDHQKTNLFRPNGTLTKTNVASNNLAHLDLLTTEVNLDDDWKQYLDYSPSSIHVQRWKRVRYVVGWIRSSQKYAKGK
ncbi:hypothetical protein L2E82_27292 [Cichorium intybus]|uniref:Uncharacterized protein n=1 Tax=Cichorium intybus TaxID=13427 RepID=A0ACB9CSQ5_CICIN|nr:hypothetical protein L2E82_27292 [Cichorium intybus]